MNATTRMSAKGQVVIPKEVRDALGLTPGQTLEVVRTGSGVLLRPAFAKSGESFAAITARIRGRNSYAGPAVTIEDMAESIGRMWAGGGPRWDP
jgi:AbrB family looped-hinge helix DNA binding protein